MRAAVPPAGLYSPRATHRAIVSAIRSRSLTRTINKEAGRAAPFRQGLDASAVRGVSPVFRALLVQAGRSPSPRPGPGRKSPLIGAGLAGLHPQPSKQWKKEHMNSPNKMTNSVMHGDCIDLMKQLPAAGVDFILTDPPYITRYKDRSGRVVANDDNGRWLQPAFAEMFRVLKDDSFCASFHGWSKADLFIAAWRQAGFQIVGHIVFRKRYASSTRFLEYRHEQAYLLAKGNPAAPDRAPPDVIDWTYTGNRLHPTQKPVGILKPLIEAFSKPGDIILDPFCGSGSTLAAAQELNRHSVGYELDALHCQKARDRLAQQADVRSAV